MNPLKLKLSEKEEPPPPPLPLTRLVTLPNIREDSSIGLTFREQSVPPVITGIAKGIQDVTNQVQVGDKIAALILPDGTRISHLTVRKLQEHLKTIDSDSVSLVVASPEWDEEEGQVTASSPAEETDEAPSRRALLVQQDLDSYNRVVDESDVHQGAFRIAGPRHHSSLISDETPE